MPDFAHNRLDRYLAGELSGREQRELAQEALDEPELFDVLAASAVVKRIVLRDAGLESVGAAKGASGRGFKRSGPALTLAALATAAAAVIALVAIYRSSSETISPPQTTSSAPSNPSSDATAGVDSKAAATRPLILSARLDELAGRSTAAFRTVEDDSRSPKSGGVIVSVDAGEVAVDLGSLDGVAKGSVLRVFRGSDASKPVGRLTLATVFRERSRGRAASPAALQAGDRVELSPDVHVGALLDQVAARISAGDDHAALAAAKRAVAGAGSPGVRAGRRRQALDQLGTLEHRAGALDDAARHLRTAVGELDGVPAAASLERARILNELGAVLIERGEYGEAEKILRVAEPYATGSIAVHVTNNLAALVELRGDRVSADRTYRSALALAGDSRALESDRRAIETNLERLRASR